MEKKNRPRKQVDFIVRIGGMLLILATMMSVGSEKVVAKTMDDETIYTSTESVLEKTYSELISSLDDEVFGDYLSTLEQGDSYVIPGIDKTNILNEQICSGMIPQGVCVAGNYLLISAYDSSNKIACNEEANVTQQKSVLYVMDALSRSYITTITLNTKCHVGALAYNEEDDLVYVANSSRNVVQILSMDKIRRCVEDGQDAKPDVLLFEKEYIDTKGYRPSFLAYYQGYLYVGQFACKNRNQHIDNEIVVFKKDGTLLKRDSIAIPYQAQGVAFAEWKDNTYMMISASYGRDKPAKIFIYLMDERWDGSLYRNHKVGEMKCPNMSEDIDIIGDCIYTCYESASNLYRLALDENGESSNVVDRIMVSSFRKTLGLLLKGDPMLYVEKLEEVVKQYSIPIQIYMDYDQRRRLFLCL